MPGYFAEREVSAMPDYFAEREVSAMPDYFAEREGSATADYSLCVHRLFNSAIMQLNAGTTTAL